MPYNPGITDQRGQIISDSRRRGLGILMQILASQQANATELASNKAELGGLLGHDTGPNPATGMDPGTSASGPEGDMEQQWKQEAKTKGSIDTVLANEYGISKAKLSTMGLGETRGLLKAVASRQAFTEAAQRMKLQEQQMNHYKLLDHIAQQDAAARTARTENLGRLGYSVSKGIMGDYMENPEAERYRQRPMLAEAVYQNPAIAADAAPSLLEYVGRTQGGRGSPIPRGTTVRAGDVDVPMVYNEMTGAQEIVPGYSMAPKTPAPGTSGTDPTMWTWQQKQEYTTLNQQIRDAQTELNKLRGKKEPAAVDAALAILDRIQVLEAQKRKMLGQPVDEPNRFTVEPIE